MKAIFAFLFIVVLAVSAANLRKPTTTVPAKNATTTAKPSTASQVVKTVGDISKIVGDASKIIGGLQGGNSEEYFHINVGKILDTADKVAEVAEPIIEVAGDASYINLKKVVKTVGTVAKVASEATKIIGDLSGSNSEEYLNLGNVAKTVGEVAQIAGDASKIVGAFSGSNTEEYFHINVGKILDTADKVAEVAEPIVEAAGDASYLNLKKVVKTVGTVAKVAGEATKIIGDLQGDNSEENLHIHIDWKKVGSVASKGLDIASKVGEVAEPIIEAAGDASFLNLGNVAKTVGEVAQIAGDASKIIGDFSGNTEEYLNLKNVVKTVGTVAKIAGEAGKIIGDLQGNNGEENLSIGSIYHTVNNIGKKAVPIALLGARIAAESS